MRSLHTPTHVRPAYLELAGSSWELTDEDRATRAGTPSYFLDLATIID